MKKKTLIIDGPYLSHRSNEAPYELHRSDGTRVTHIHAFIKTLNTLRNQFNPSQTIIAWESHGTPSWRREMYPPYKPSSPGQKVYIEQREDIKKIVHLFGISQYHSPTNEADDVIARLAKKHKPSIIFTVDKDMYQIIDSQTHIWDGKKIIDSSAVEEKFKVPPNKIVEFLSILGDSSDSIPGMKGYGLVKSSKLLKEHTFDELLEGQFKSHRKELVRNRTLITLNKNCELIRFKMKTNETLDELFDKYELKQIKKKNKSLEESLE